MTFKVPVPSNHRESLLENKFIVKKEDHVAWIIFDRPNKLNAMRSEGWREFGRILGELSTDRSLRCLIIAGEGKAFQAGHDIGQMLEHIEDMKTGDYTVADLHEGQKALQETTRLIRKARFPVIAAVHGFAVGGGCEVTLACDLVVAGESTRMGFPEAKVGATITNGGTWLLPRKVGLGKARELAFMGEIIDAQEALKIGLVNRVVPDDQLRAEAEQMAAKICAMSPMSVQLHKTMLDRGQEASLETMLNFETECLVVASIMKDHIEGVHAFHERREPTFKGY